MANKLCPKCREEHGPRKKNCECGYSFAAVQASTIPKRNHPSPPTMVTMNDPRQIRALIDGLRQSLEYAQRSGGCYTAFAHHKLGVIGIQVQLSLKNRDLVL